MNIKKALKTSLYRLLAENDITLDEFSTGIDVPLNVGIGIVNGVIRPKISTLCRIADYFGVSIDYLLGRSDKYWL